MSLQNPNALDSKVLLDFDHVKNSLKVDDEGKHLVSFLPCEVARQIIESSFMLTLTYYRFEENE